MSDICITLTSDFGTADPYVAAMKGAILTVNPGATVVDVTHHVQPQNIRHGSYVLGEAAMVFPPATIHIAVVDPGVGGSRNVLCAEIDSHRFIAPDNGLLTAVMERWPLTRAFAVTRRKYFRETVSATFHGRDIMAPVAGHLSLGLDPAELGPPVRDPIRLPLPEPVRTSDGFEAEVLWVDHFGNVVTNLRREHLARAGDGEPVVELGEERLVGLAGTYETVAAGQGLLVVGSSDRLEIAVRDGNAASRFGVTAGDTLQVSIR